MAEFDMTARPVVAAAAVGMAVMAAIPLVLVTYPPLQDLPNHLARIVVLRASPGDPLVDYYAVHWGLIPNLATDALLLALAQVLPLAAASRVAVGILGALWLVAPLLLHRALYRRWSVVPLVGGLFLFNRALDFGFLNFLLGSSLAVIAFATWIMLAERSFLLRAACGVAMGAILFLSHLFAFGVFAVCVLLWELPPSVRRPFGQRFALLGAIAAPAAVGLWLGPHELRGAATSYAFVADNFPAFVAAKLGQFRSFVTVDRFDAGLATMLLVALVVVSAVQRNLAPRMAIICLVLFAMFVLLPYRLVGGTHVDWRMLAPLALVAAGSIRIGLGRLQGVALAAALFVMFGLQVSQIAASWQRGERLYEQFGVASKALPMNARLLYAAIGDRNGRFSGAPSLLHFGGLATIERNAVVPSLFAAPSRQPIRILPPFDRLHREFSNAWFSDTKDIDWELAMAEFDYVMLAAASAPIVPEDLEPIGSSGPFHLYRVRR